MNPELTQKIEQIVGGAEDWGYSLGRGLRFGNDDNFEGIEPEIAVKGLLVLIHTERLALLEQMEGIIGEDETTDSHSAWDQYAKGSPAMQQFYENRNKLRTQQRMELQKLKEAKSE